MTSKQRAFVAEYIKDFNASAAARRAGYSERSAYAIGSRLLRKVEVSKAIGQALEERAMSACA
ncbi:MAG: terminase small subunit [Truepera sp.]|nr:terminase small subunit [Truepera sp.]